MNVIVDVIGLAGIVLIALVGVLAVGYLNAVQLRHNDRNRRNDTEENERKQS